MKRFLGIGSEPVRMHDEQRRQTLKFLAGAGVIALVGCGSSSGSNGSAAASTTTTTTTDAEPTGGSDGTDAIPEETAGPYPADGSNGVNVLTESGVVRSDIRSSFGTASGSRRECR